MKRLIASAAGLGIAIAAIVALALLAGSGRAGGVSLTDGLDFEMPARGVPRRTIVWSTPVEIPGVSDSGDTHDFDPATDARGTLLIFARGQTGGGADLYESVWDGRAWGAPRAIDELNSAFDDLSPALSSDGRMLIFASDRGTPESGGRDFDLWISNRSDSGWSIPTPMQGANSPFDEYDPALAPDQDTLLFSSNRPRDDAAHTASGAWQATIRAGRAAPDFDIYEGDLAHDGISGVRPAETLNSSANDGTPAFSPLGDFVYFSSDRPGAGGFDLYRSRRTRDGLGTPEPLGPPINTPSHEMDPSLQSDGFRLIFSTDRAGRVPGDGGDARFELFESVSREAFAAKSPIDRAWVWSALWPWLLALAALALLLLLLRAARRLRGNERLAAAWRRLSLLTKCVLVSVLLHVLLLMGLAVWRVQTVLEEFFREREQGVHVVLAAAPDASEDFVRQLRQGADTARPHVIDAPTAPSPSPDMPEPASQMLTPDPPSVHAPPETQLSSMRTHAELLASDREPTEAPIQTNASPVRVDLPTMTDDPPVAEPLEARAKPTPLAMVSPGAPSIPRDSLSAQDPPRPPARIEATPLEARMPAAPSAPSLRLTDAPDAMPSTSTPNFTEPAIPSANAEPIAETDPPVDSSLIIAPAPAMAASSAALEPMAAEPLEPARSRLDAPAPPTIETARRAVHAPAPMPFGEPAPIAQLVQPALPEVSPERRESRDAAPSELTDSRRAGAPPVGVSAPAIEPPTHDPAWRAPDIEVASEQPMPTRVAARAPASEMVVAPALPELRAALDRVSRPPVEDADPVPEAYPQRAPEARAELVERGGGSRQTEHAVAAALDWLARHQHTDGRWSSRGFDDDCGGCPGAARFEFDPATTGLALLCFLGTDHGRAGDDSEYARAVRRGVAWIVAQQENNGDLRAGGTMYTQGIATIALCEAYALSRDPELMEPIRRAVGFIERARSAEGGWRYEPGQSGDTSVLGWQVMALESARRCGVEVDPASLQAAAEWLDAVGAPRAPGRYAYQRGMPPTASMTAEGMFVRQLLGAGARDERQETSARFVVRELPAWERDANTYAWYYATLALYQHGGEHWTRWNDALVRELLASQRDDGAAAGSWDPNDQWSNIGGRVYQTALCTLSLQVYYRYLPAYLGPRDPIMNAE